jgi:twitching motility protein PilI
MANKEALRELQSRLARRLSDAKAQPSGKSWLAVECGTRGFLFPLRDAGEIYALAPMLPVPHTHRWFLGVSNLRGHLHGVVDLAGFLGVKSEDVGREQARLVGFNQGLQINCALLVDRLSGLRAQEQLTLLAEEAVASRPPFVGDRYRDAAGRSWQEINLAELAGDENFLRIVG